MIDYEIGKKYNEPNIGIHYSIHVSRNLIEQCYNEIDKKIYESSNTPLNKFIEWIYEYPDFCYVFIDLETKKPIGYFYIFPLNDDTCKKIISGSLTHYELKLDNFVPVRKQGLYNLYISSAVFLEPYQNGNMAKMLFDLVIGTIIKKAKNSKYINSIFMEVVNDFEKTVISLFGANKVSTNKLGRDIYGSIFNIENFKKLSTYPVLEFAYTCDHAEEFLKDRKNIFED